ncbi:hypothetical protein H6F76_16315 [Leptolyngbya sp. FACHB-321]|uniref:hypothetical protein n=1 Tax=Leptolyngbya sp. FACHB-321 TaxID=2692807 RepID=UPI001687CCF0|nr:hypothetical protein [Leptolyngbya sp. FACHB-321]MBD2036577.1 hypothetical protein [Leptolyngbya sp. FACHB-321]
MMDNPLSNSQESTLEKSENRQVSFPTFASRTLKAGFALLVFGAIFIVLIKFNAGGPEILLFPPDPIPFAGGAIVLVALTLLGVPLIPAATAGVAIWWLIQDFFF